MKKLLAVGLSVLLGFVLAAVLLVPRLPVRAGLAAVPAGNGDVNGDGAIDVSDAIFTLLYLFKGGPEPVACADSPELVARVESLEQNSERAWGVISDLVTPPGQGVANRFVDNDDGTIRDTRTGLTWQRQHPNPSTLLWHEAVQYCSDLDLAGHSDWRLPTVKEWGTLQNQVLHLWQLDVTVEPGFPITQSHMWSSTPAPSFAGEDYVFVAQIWNGYLLRTPKSASMYVLAVRGP